MTKYQIVKSFFVFLVAACAVAALVVVDAGALSQNTNSSDTTTQEDANTNAEANTNTNTSARRGRGRRGRRAARRAARRARAMENANAEMTGNENTSDTMPATDTTGAQDTGASSAQSTGGGTNEDLSGTFTGRITMTGGHEMSGAATFTITGNTFTLESEGMTHSGRIFAVNTRRYIGAALFFTDLPDSATNTPLACSVRVRRRGNSISMTPVPGSRNRLTFTGRSS